MSVCNILDQNSKIGTQFLPVIVHNEYGAVQTSFAICNSELILTCNGNTGNYGAYTANVVTSISSAQFSIQNTGTAKLDIGVQFRNVQFTAGLNQNIASDSPLITRVPLYIWPVGEVNFGYTQSKPYKTFLEFVQVTEINTSNFYTVFNVNQTIEFTDYFTAQPETGYIGIQMTIGAPPFGITRDASYTLSNVNIVASQGLAVKPLFPTKPLYFTFGLSLLNQ